MALSAADSERYRRDGFLALEDFIADAECDRLRARMDELLADFDPAGIRTIFATDDQRHAQDAWFLESGDRIRFFFEARAFDAEGALRQPKELAVNKAGHALHDLDPTFAAFSRDPRFASVAAAIGIARPLLLQSMYIFKQPRIGGEVTCHQDSASSESEPVAIPHGD